MDAAQAAPAPAAAAAPVLSQAWYNEEHLVPAALLMCDFYCDGCGGALCAAEPSKEELAALMARRFRPAEEAEELQIIWGRPFHHYYGHTHNTIDACKQCWENGMADQMANPRLGNESVFEECTLCRDLADRRWHRVGGAHVCGACHPSLMQRTVLVDPGEVLVRRQAIFSSAQASDGLEMPPGIVADPGLSDVWTRVVEPRITETAGVPPNTVLGDWTLLEPLVPETPYVDYGGPQHEAKKWVGLAVEQKAPFRVASVVIVGHGGTMTMVHDTFDGYREARAEWDAMRLAKPVVPRRLAVGDGWHEHRLESSVSFAEWLAWSQDQGFGPDQVNC